MWDEFNSTDKIQFALMVWSCPAEVIPSGSCCLPSIWWVIPPEHTFPVHNLAWIKLLSLQKWQLDSKIRINHYYSSLLEIYWHLMPRALAGYKYKFLFTRECCKLNFPIVKHPTEYITWSSICQVITRVLNLSTGKYTIHIIWKDFPIVHIKFIGAHEDQFTCHEEHNLTCENILFNLVCSKGSFRKQKVKLTLKTSVGYLRWGLSLFNRKRRLGLWSLKGLGLYQTRKFSKRQIIIGNKSHFNHSLFNLSPLMIFYEADLSVKLSKFQAALLTSWQVTTHQSLPHLRLE